MSTIVGTSIGKIIFINLFSANLIIGLIATWITKNFRFLSNHQGVTNAITIYAAYLSFSICEGFGFSGIISVMLCAVIMSHYLTYNLSKSSAASSKYCINILYYLKG